MTQARSGRWIAAAVLGPEANPVTAHALYALLFSVTVLLGRLTAVQVNGAALVWPAAGVAFVWCLVATLSAGRRSTRIQRVRLRALVVGSVGATIVLIATVINVFSGMTPEKALVYSVGNAAAGGLAAACYLLIVREDRWWLTRARQLPALVLASLVAAVGNALCGPVYSALTDGSMASMYQALPRTAVGTLVFGAALLRLLSPKPIAPRSGPWAQVGLLVLAISGYLVTFFAFPHLPITFVLTCVSVTAAMVLTVDGFMAFLLVTGSATVLTSMLDVGPFGTGAVTQDIFIAQGFVGTQIVLGLLLTLGREDITRLLTEVSLARGEAETRSGLMRVVLSGMSDAVVAVDGDRVIHGNPAAAAMFGLRDGDRMGVSEISTGEADGQAPLDRARRGIAVTEDIDHESGHGHQVLSVRAHPLGGGADRAVLVARDVTEHRRHVAELASFASVVAHDLLNPIGAVEGWLEVAEDELGPKTSPLLGKAVARARSSILRARDIVTGLHSYSVARGGELSMADLDLQEFVGDLARARVAAAEVGAGRPEIEVNTPLWVRADRVLLGQVVDNLLGNAIKYSRADLAPRIEVTADVVDGVARVRIDDNGIGIPSSEREDVFTEFHRVDAHRQGAAGTGLGLSICRRMIERHGGTIGAFPSPAGGTRIEFTLPLGEAPPSATAEDLVGDIAAQNRAAAATSEAVARQRQIRVGSARR